MCPSPICNSISHFPATMVQVCLEFFLIFEDELQNLMACKFPTAFSSAPSVGLQGNTLHAWCHGNTTCTFWSVQTRAFNRRHVLLSERHATALRSLVQFQVICQVYANSFDRTVFQIVAQEPVTNSQMHQQCRCGSVSAFFFVHFVLSDLSIRLWFETSTRIHNSVSLSHFQNKINRVDIENDANRPSSI